jgi:hypothetical protein
MQYLTREHIILETEKIFAAFTVACKATEEQIFFYQPADKWSVAENVQHLITSTNISRLAYTLPAFIVRWMGGKPNRGSKSYEALVQKYQAKLAEGGRATGRFIPKKSAIDYSKEKLLQQWQKACAKFVAALKKNTTESKLDDYLVKHPLLGRITLRELCYFTIYHTEHHLNIINSRIAA